MPQILRALLVRDVTHTLYPRFPSGLLWHLWVTRPLRARAWTPALILHLSNPCTKPKGSQPNETQRHKTKSLGHYITITHKGWYAIKQRNQTNINNLFTHSLNGFNYCYLSAIDVQSLPSSIFRIIQDWVLVCCKSNWNMIGTII